MNMSSPLRIAVVGTGPAGMYAVGHILEARGPNIEVDLFERLPTPWGLVRAGVAPDHPEKKLVISRQFEFFLKSPRVHFFGNVDIGRDIRPAELSEWYDAVIYATGADGDTRMGIPGEDLRGCWSARQFVGFYNGHPDYRDLAFDLSCERAIVVGNGNVAFDVARMLTMSVAELARTDIADHALAVLRRSAIREVLILGRRSPLQGAFHNPELEELEHLEGVDVLVEGNDLPVDADALQHGVDWETLRKITTLRRFARRQPSTGNKRIVLRFLTSPVELLGDGKVERMVVARNHLERDLQGRLQARPSEEKSILATGLVLRAIGYRGSPFAGLPFDERLGVIRNRSGRVMDGDRVLAGAYVTGWIKRGCRGIIGTNKKCARESVDCLLEDIEAGRLIQHGLARDAVQAAVRSKKSNAVSRSGWLAIDHAERVAGRAQRRPRVKMTDMATMVSCAKTS
jgi:ferredoxin/flavodoxin---NADP+ reductase